MYRGYWSSRAPLSGGEKLSDASGSGVGNCKLLAKKGVLL
jgi:hypothetical protein